MSVTLFREDDMWPSGILTIFEIAHREKGRMNRYFPPYNKLLEYCFGPDEFRFCIGPQKPPEMRNKNLKIDPVSFVVYTIVGNRMRAILFVDVKDESQAEYAELCKLADREMRQR
jgi:hypothetical protein